MTWLDILSDLEIQELRNARSAGLTHPVVELALAEGERQVTTNTEMAARQVLRENGRWLRALRPRLLDDKDFTAAASALGEIRAYGALLETWCKVRAAPSVPGSNVRPEFEADAGDGPVIVEVHFRQLDSHQIASLARHDADLQARHAAKVAAAKAAGVTKKAAGVTKNVVTTSVTEVFPTGAPVAGKAGDSVLTNTISRIASVKNNENQIDPARSHSCSGLICRIRASGAFRSRTSYSGLSTPGAKTGLSAADRSGSPYMAARAVPCWSRADSTTGARRCCMMGASTRRWLAIALRHGFLLWSTRSRAEPSSWSTPPLQRRFRLTSGLRC